MLGAPSARRQLVVDEAWLAYSNSNKFGGGSFRGFLRDWLSDRDLYDLSIRGGSAQEREQRMLGNEDFIAERRQQLRNELYALAESDQLRWSEARVGQFVIAPRMKGNVQLLSSSDDQD